MPRRLTVKVLCPKCDGAMWQEELVADFYRQTCKPIALPNFPLYCIQCGVSFPARECGLSEVKHD